MQKSTIKTILLVEDEAIIAMTEKMTLERYGYRVVTVNSGEQAVAIVDAETGIDLILMDIDLGSGIDGTQAAEKILFKFDIPVVFVSSHTEPEIVRKTEKITSYGYVVKNSSITVLDASIKMAFKLFDAYRDLQIKSQEEHEHAQILENIMDNFPGGIFWKDTRLNYQGCSKTFAFGAGLSSPKDIIGKSDYDLPWKEHEADGYRADDRSVVENGEARVHIQETQFTASGSTISFDTTKIPLFNMSREIVGLLGVSIDVTERVTKQNELLKLSKAIDASSATVMLTDADGNIEYVNPKFEQLTGYGAAEVIGKNPRFLKSGNTEKSVYTELWDAIASGNEWKGQFQNKKKNGEIYFESAIIAPVRDIKGKIINYIAIKEDITERKAISNSLKKSEERYRMLSENTCDGIIHFDRSGAVDYMSPVYKKLFCGAEPEEVEKNWHEICGRMHDEDRDAVIAQLRDAIADKKSDMLYHFRMKSGDGREIRREDHAAFVYDENGRYDGTYVICRDITSRVMAEESCRQSNELLQTVLNGIPQAICWKDTESRFLGCNGIFASVAGFRDPSDLIGKSDWDLALDAKEIENIRMTDSMVMKTDEPRFDVKVCARETRHPGLEYNTTIAPLHDSTGIVSGCVTICDLPLERRKNGMPAFI